MTRVLLYLALAFCLLVVCSPLVLAAPPGDSGMTPRMMAAPAEMAPPRTMTDPPSMMPPYKMRKARRMTPPQSMRQGNRMTPQDQIRQGRPMRMPPAKPSIQQQQQSMMPK